MDKIKVVINGAGASGIAVAKLLISAGAENIVLCDINAAVVEGNTTFNKGVCKAVCNAVVEVAEKNREITA